MNINTTLAFPVQNDPHHQSICVICLENFQQQEIITQLACLHIYHSQCLPKNLDGCPKCRAFSMIEHIKAFDYLDDQEMLNLVRKMDDHQREELIFHFGDLDNRIMRSLEVIQDEESSQCRKKFLKLIAVVVFFVTSAGLILKINPT
jgi:hypothetical protein